MMSPNEMTSYYREAVSDICLDVEPEKQSEMYRLLDEQLKDMQTDYENSLCLHPTKSMSKLNLSETR